MKMPLNSFVAILALLCVAGTGFSQTVIPVQAGAPAGADLKSALLYVNTGIVSKPVIELVTSGGKYYLSASDSVKVPLTIRAAKGLAAKPVIKPANGDTVTFFFRVKNDFTLQGIILDSQFDNGAYNLIGAIVSVDPIDGKLRPDVTITDCVFKNIYETGDPVGAITGNAFQTANGALAGAIKFENTTFMNYADEPILMQQMNKTPGSIDTVIIRNCTFYNANDNAKNQGQFTIKSDTDLATPEPVIVLENLTFYNCGTAFLIRDCPNVTVRNIIIANVNVKASGGMLGSIGRSGSVISHVDTFKVGGGSFNIKDAKTVGGGNAKLDSATIYNLDPMFADPAKGDFTVKNPALYTLAHDGGLLGDRRWADPAIATGVGHAHVSTVPEAFSVSQNYPNPFNPVTRIRYTLKKQTHVKLQILNMLGDVIETLINENNAAGQHVVTWDASKVSSGIYFCRILADGQATTRKMTLMK